MAKVEAPNKDYNGTGPGDAVFVDGVADVDDAAALNYYRSAGYTVSGKVQNPLEDPEPADPREVAVEVLGNRLRDAAVDPHKDDFLAPTNAGKDNPHGSTVVSPEIHASGPAGIRPGVVFVEDTAKQEQRETEFATARLVDHDTLGAAIAAEVPNLEDRGKLDLSDPGSANVGRTDGTDEGDGETTEVEQPAKSASKAAWVTYAVAQGADQAEAEAVTRDDLRDAYGS